MKRNNLIGIILQSLLNEYNAGACDNMSEEQMQSISKQLNYIRLEIGNYQEKVLTTEEASIYLNVTRWTINNYVKQGKLHPQKHLGGVNEFKKSELDQLLKKKQ